MAGPGPTPLWVKHLPMEGGAAVVAVYGELDLATRGELRSTLSLLGDAYGRVVVDLSGLEFCDVAGFRSLCDAHETLRAAHGNLTLRSPGRGLRRLIAFSGVPFDVEPSVDGQL